MKLNTPIVMTRFKCKADKCTDSCCIGWEIDINESTEALYRALKGDIGERVRRGITPSCRDESAHFILDSQDRCPMLNPDGLCSLIIEGGDDLLTEICREHPRYYNVYSDYAEMGLGLSCEAAAELILCSESEKLLTVDIREDDTLLEDRGLPAIGPLLEERAKLLELSIDRSLSLPDTFRKMLGLDTVNSKAMSYSSLGKLLSELEAIDESYPSMITEAALRADRNREEMLDHLSYISENGGRAIIFSELHRHYLDSVYMLDSKERISYAFVFLVSVALLSFGKKSTDELIKATVLTSKNLDYSTENTESILYALSDDTITSRELLYLIGG